MVDRLDRRALSWLAAGHVVNDMNQGAVPALLPFLIAERGLTYTAAGGIVLAATLLSSLIQPVLGHLSDRRPLPFLIPLGVLAAGGGLALAGAVTSYPATIAAILLSGAGVAAFHPESARYANYASGERRATGMSVFSVGGKLGIALGPVAIAALAGSGGVARITWMILPAGLMAALLARELPQLRPLRPQVAHALAQAGADGPRWRAFARLSGVIVIRSLFAFGLVSFVPLYLVRVRGVPKEAAALAVTAMLLAGAPATLACLFSGLSPTVRVSRPFFRFSRRPPCWPRRFRPRSRGHAPPSDGKPRAQREIRGEELAHEHEDEAHVEKTRRRNGCQHPGSVAGGSGRGGAVRGDRGGLLKRALERVLLRLRHELGSARIVRPIV